MKVQVSLYGAWTNSSILKINSDERWKNKLPLLIWAFSGWTWNRFVWGLEVQTPVHRATCCHCFLSEVIGEIVQNPGFKKSKFIRVTLALSSIPQTSLHTTLKRGLLCVLLAYGHTNPPTLWCPTPENQGKVSRGQPRAPTCLLQGREQYSLQRGDKVRARLTFKTEEFLLACPSLFFVRLCLGSQKTGLCWCAVPDNEETGSWGRM